MTANKENQKSKVNDPLTTPGERLQLAREEAGLSLEFVSGELYMTATKVKNLEADEYDKLHSAMFIRGYIRSYAKLLKLDDSELIACFDDYTGTKSSASIVHMKKVNAQSKDVSGYLSGNKPLVMSLFVIVLMVLVFTLSGNENTAGAGAGAGAGDGSALVNGSIEDEIEADAGKNLDDAFTADAASATDKFSTAEKSLKITKVATSADESVAGASGGVGIRTSISTVLPLTSNSMQLDSLRLTFTDECWVEVTDALNDVLFADVKMAGDSLALEGVAPFNVMLGNVRAVELTFNGKAVDKQVEDDRKTLKFVVQ